MSKSIYTTTLRLNLDKPEDREAWEHLQRLDRAQYRSVNCAVIAAVNAFFGRQEQLAADPYLETREKEAAFLQEIRGPSGRACRKQPPLVLLRFSGFRAAGAGDPRNQKTGRTAQRP